MSIYPGVLQELKDFLCKYCDENGEVTLQCLLDQAKQQNVLSDKAFFILLKTETVLNSMQIISWVHCYELIKENLKNFENLYVFLWGPTDNNCSYFIYNFKKQLIEATLIYESSNYNQCPKGTAQSESQLIALEILLFSNNSVAAVMLLNLKNNEAHFESYNSMIRRILKQGLQISNVRLKELLLQGIPSLKTRFINYVPIRQMTDKDIVERFDFF